MKTLITGVAAMLLCATLHAQDAAEPEMQAAKEHVAAYPAVLGIDEKQQTRMTDHFLAGEREKAPLMKELNALKAKIAAVDAAAVAAAEAELTEKQKEQLTALEKEGKWTSGASCSKDTSAKGCCAGKAGAHGDKGAKAHAPAPQSMQPAHK
jgi:hypothetical protein